VVRELAEKVTKADLNLLRERLEAMRAVMDDDHAWGEAVAAGRVLPYVQCHATRPGGATALKTAARAVSGGRVFFTRR